MVSPIHHLQTIIAAFSPGVNEVAVSFETCSLSQSWICPTQSFWVFSPKEAQGWEWLALVCENHRREGKGAIKKKRKRRDSHLKTGYGFCSVGCKHCTQLGRRKNKVCGPSPHLCIQTILFITVPAGIKSFKNKAFHEATTAAGDTAVISALWAGHQASFKDLGWTSVHLQRRQKLSVKYVFEEAGMWDGKTVFFLDFCEWTNDHNNTLHFYRVYLIAQQQQDGSIFRNLLPPEWYPHRPPSE